MGRTFAYIRANGPDEADEQRKAITAFFDRDGRGYDRTAYKPTWLVDGLRSARSRPFHERPQGAAFLDACRSGDELVVHTFDRLCRKAGEMCYLFDLLADQGVKLTVVGTVENAVIYDIDGTTCKLFSDAMAHLGLR